jgi:dienelactone hydrolase
MIPSILTKSLLCPRRQPLVKNPGDYGMTYEDVEFTAPDNVLIKGWLIHGTLDKLIIVTHPMPFTRYGFSIKHQGIFKVSDREVELLRTAVHLHKQGYHILTFDFRNHGKSGRGNGGFTGVGLHEWPDVAGALDFIRTHEKLKNKDIGFVSYCMGANATIMAMSKAKELFTHVKCLAAVQPVSMDILVPKMIRDTFPAFAAFIPNIEKKCKKYTGYSLKDMSPLEYVKDISVPVLYAQVKDDPWTEPRDVESFYKNTTAPKELFWIENKKHRFDGYNYFGDNPGRLLEFLKKHL